MRLLARKTTEAATTQIYLSRPDQISQFVEGGWTVYQVDANENETLVADPDQGQIISLSPNCSQSSGSTGSSGSDLAEALDIILNGE